MRLVQYLALGTMPFLLLAQSANPWSNTPATGAWVINGGVATLVTSAYQGTGGAQVRAVPYVSARYGPFVFSPIEGLGVRLRSGERWSYGAFLGAGFDKRRETDSVQPELKLNALYDLGTWDAGLSLKQRLGNADNRGLSLEGDLRYTFWETPALRLRSSLVVAWMDAAYGRNIFGTGAGFKSVGLNVNAFYTLSPEWSLIGVVGLSELQGEARRSPLVYRTHKTTAVIGAIYQF
jgi:outer membrane scaffolding protein for murein synthesis (MipA/OmpV family)